MSRTDAAATEAAVARAVAAFQAWRDVRPAARRARAAARRGTARAQGRPRRARHYRGREDRAGGPRRGAGDDRHLRLRRRLSRQLYGKSIASERPGHRLTETWHPLGPVAVISAFNFPVAVWSWNAALALVCGDPVIWKPSERTPLTAIATTSLLRRAADRFGDVPDGLFELVLGGADRAVQLADDARIPLSPRRGRPPWARRSRRASPRGSVVTARARRQQRRDRRAERRSRPRRPRGAVRRRRHRGPALHLAAAADRPRVRGRRAARAAGERLRSVPIGDPREAGTLVGPLVTGERSNA